MPRVSRLLGAFLLSLSAFSWPVPCAAAAEPARLPDGSLEGFLRRLRAAGEAEHARLQPRVDELAKKLGLARSPIETEKLLKELEALGSEAVPLLLSYLDPGPAPSAENERQAREIAGVLERSRHPALLEDLVGLARTGSPRGQLLAVRVLGSSPEVERAASAVRALHPGTSAPLRAECVTTLARLAPRDQALEEPLVLTALTDASPEVRRAGLRALKAEPREAPRAEVVALLGDQGRGADVLAELVEYFCVPGQALSEDVALALIAFARREDLPVEARLKVLEGLPRSGVGLTSRVRKELEPLATSPDTALRIGTLVALTLMKDSRARRELMREHDEQVRSNATWPLAYQRRGDIELRIGEYRDAARDYQQALDLHGESARLPGNRDIWVNLACAHVKDGKLKAAHDALVAFGLTADLRRTIKADPAFAALVEHPKYKTLFD